MVLLAHTAHDAQLQDLYLAMTEQFAAALCFYEKNGFVGLVEEALPKTFPRIPPEIRFYRRTLSCAGRAAMNCWQEPLPIPGEHQSGGTSSDLLRATRFFAAAHGKMH